MRATVHILPDTVPRHALDGAQVVVIDVLRATSTMLRALQLGASAIWPVASLSAAFRLRRERLPAALLAGERRSLRPQGFDFGNSPRELDANRLAGRPLIFTTTNGTRALLRAQDAARLTIGSFANLGALAQTLQGEADLHIICAGTKRQPSWEDLLAAGALLERLHSPETNDTGLLARTIYRAHAHDLYAALLASTHGQSLVALGYQEDLSFIAQPDTIPLIPTYAHGALRLD